MPLWTPVVVDSCNALASKAYVNIIATNGITYKVCLHYTLTGALGNVRIYDYPDTILVTGGTLKRLPDNVYGMRYEFVPTVVITGGGVFNPPVDGGVIKGKGTYLGPPVNGNSQIISGVDNTILYIGIGIALFFLLKD